MSSWGREITISGDPEEVALTADLWRELIGLARSGQYLNAETAQHAIITCGHGYGIASNETILTVRPGHSRENSGRNYVDLIANHGSFWNRPAGTGKTYLAMAMAVNAL